MQIEPAWLDRVLKARMPRTSARARLELVEWSGKFGLAAATTGLSEAGLWACLKLALGDGPNGSTAICVLVGPDQLDQPAARVEAYLDGWLTVVDDFLAQAAPQVLSLATPANLVCPAALGLARPKVAEDFRVALLAPRRLGKLLGDPIAAMRSLDSGRA